MKRFYYTLLLTLVGSTSYGQFSSSVCGAGALPIQCAPNTVNLTSGYTNSGIIDPETENGTGCSSVGSDITAGTIYDYDGWFTTTADASGLVEVYAAIISGDPVIGLYSGPCSSPTLLSCDDDGGAGLDAYISQSGLTPGGTYWVRIWDYNGGTGTYEVTTNGGTPPANDDCASADGLTVNGSAVSGTTYCATVETSDWNDCESNTENNVWYTFTTSYDGDITVNFSSIDCFGSGAGIDVSVFYGNCSSFTSYGCTSVSAGSTGSITQFTGPAGTYYVMVDGDNSGGATSLCDFDVDVDFSADPCSAAGGGAPANDDCSSATSLVENGAPVAGTVYCATVETSDYDDCEANTENNVWYTFTASGNGNVNVNVFPNNCFTSNDELDVSVFSGSCGSFVGVTCGTVGSTLNTISFNANSGTTYYIMVDGANDGTTTSNCDFDIDIDFSLVCPTPGYTDITNGGTLLSANNPYDCDDQFYLRADLIGAAGGVLAPGIDILVDGNTFDAYTNAEFSITVYQDYGSGYVSVIDWPVGTFPNGPVGTVYTLTNYFLDPTVPTMVEFCDAYGDGAVDYSIDDAVTGANITAWSTADFDAIPGTASSECVQIIIPANTMTATSTWTITPVVDPNAFITFPDGYAYVNTAYMTAGTYDITYIFDDGNGCYSTSTQTLEVGPAPTVVPVIDSLCGDGSGNGVFDLTSYNSTANGGTGNTVSWYDNTVTLIPTPGSYTVNSSSSPDTVYSIIEEATSLCLAAGLNQFVVTESPTVSIAPDPVDVCEGEDAAIVATGLGGTGFLTYAWTGTGAGNLDNTANPSPTFNSASTGTQSLTITATDNVGCTATDNISVNVYPVPATPTISTTPPSCSADGASTVTNYNSGYTYTFSPAGPSVGAGGSISGMTYGTSYTVVADNGNCTSSASSSFSISAMYITPILSSVTNPEVCADANSVDLGSLTPSVTNGVAGIGQWYVGNSNAGSTTSGTQSGLSNGDQFFYEYTATSGGCSDNVTITVTVNVLPNASAGSDVVIDCNSSGGQEVLDGSGSDAGMNYSWTTGTGNIVSGSGTTAPTVDAAGTYTITVTNAANGCSAADDAIVTTDFATPTASVASPSQLDCSSPSVVVDGSASLNSSGTTVGLTYSWSGSNGGVISGSTTGATITATSAGDYTLIVTQSNGCTDQTTVSVSADASLPTSVITGNADLTCAVTTITLDGSTSTGGTLTYEWQDASNNPIGTNTTYDVTTPGTYYLEVTNTLNSCVNTTSVIVNQDITTPSVVIAAPIDVDCNNPVVQLDGSGSDAGMTYAWTTGAGNIVSGSGTTTAVVDAAGTYTITVTNATNGCSATDDVVVTEDLVVPVASAGSDVVIDCNSAGGQEILDGSGSDAGMTYVWTTSGGNIVSGSGTNSATVDAAGTYTITVTNATNGCSATDDVVVAEDLFVPLASAGSDAIIDCNSAGDQVSLDGTGSDAGMTYAWTTGTGNIVSGSGTNTAVVDAAGTYTITVTNATNGCSSTDDAVVTEDLVAPIAGAGPDVVIDCNSSGGQEVLDGSGSDAGMTYAWTTGAGNVVSGSGTNSATVDAAGTYTITVTNATNGCSSTDDAIVTTDFATPTASVVSPSQLDCSNPSVVVDGSATLNSSGTTVGLTYSWTASNGGVISGASNGSTITATSAGDYTLIVTQSNGCTDQTTVSVSADASLPSAVITGNADLTCAVTTITLDGSTSTGGTLTYEWQDASNNPIGTNTTYDVTTPGTYYLEVTNTLNSCVNTTSVIVNQDITTPSVVIAAPIDVDCNNPVVQLDGSGSDQGANYTYTWTAGGSGMLLGTSDADTDSTSTADTYTLTVLNTVNGCSDFANVTVAVDTVSPISDAGVDQQISCSSPTVNIDGSTSTGTGLTYFWSGPGVVSGGATSVVTVVNQVGGYELTVTGANGCTDSDSVYVIPNVNVPIADAGIDMVIDCSNPSVLLDGSNSESGANITYSWATPTGNVVSGSGTNQATVDLDGTYGLTVTNTSNGCSAVDSVTVTMDTVSPIADAGSSSAQTITCSSVSVTLDASASSGSGLTYNWTTLTGNVVSGANTVNPDVDAAGTYVLEVMSANGCVNLDSVTITIDTVLPTATVSALGGSLNCNVTSINLDGSASTGSNVTYTWTTVDGNIVSGSSTSTPTVDAAGTYLLTVASDNGCEDTVSVEVVQTPSPVADFTATPTEGQMPLEVVFADSSSGSGLIYSWDFGDGNSDTAVNPINVYEDWGEYVAVLTVTDSAGCISQASTVITVTGLSSLTVPNIFSPNGDGVNDIFNLTGTNIKEISGSIMNRWGQLLYEWETLMSGWDGRTLAGEEAAEGVYYYFITAIGADDKEYKYEGTFELVR